MSANRIGHLIILGIVVVICLCSQTAMENVLVEVGSWVLVIIIVIVVFYVIGKIMD